MRVESARSSQQLKELGRSNFAWSRAVNSLECTLQIALYGLSEGTSLAIGYDAAYQCHQVHQRTPSEYVYSVVEPSCHVLGQWWAL